MSKLEEIYLGVRSGDIGESKFRREIKNLMLSQFEDIKSYDDMLYKRIKDKVEQL